MIARPLPHRLCAGLLLVLAPLLPVGRAVAAELDHRTYIVTLPGANGETLARVEGAGGVIDHFDGVEARAYIHISHWPAFLAENIPHRIAAIQPETAKELADYPTHGEIGTLLDRAAADYPAIARVVSLGDSVQGRAIWAIHISDQPEVEEDEPEFAYIATMHGDERVGTVLCLNFMEMLLEGYGVDDTITNWVDETSIWLVPLMNPDGYTLGIRWNANNVDLNRSFPQYPEDYAGTILTEAPPGPSGWQPEVARIMEWNLANRFVLMANYHGGALVANYPYDYTPGIPSGVAAIAPDDELLIAIAGDYARWNPPMLASAAFPGGITNGSAWYSVNGGMQDWHYRYSGAVHITLEVSTVKTPAARTLPGFWEDNRDSMAAYLAWVHRGVRGVVRERHTEVPLLAEVRVAGNSQPVFTDPDVGDFHRMLPPGTATLTVTADGYIPYTTGQLEVGTGAATRVDVALSDGDVNGDGIVNAIDLQLAMNALLGLSDIPAADVDGRGVSATDVQQVINRALGRR